MPQSISSIALTMLARAAGLSAGGDAVLEVEVDHVGGRGGHLGEELGAGAGAEELAAVRAGGRARGQGEAHGGRSFRKGIAAGASPGDRICAGGASTRCSAAKGRTGLKRRQFLVAGTTALAGAGLPAGAQVAGEAAGGASWAVGDFVLTRRGRVLAVAHGSEPERVLWETDPQGNFLVAERATFRNRVTGIPEGSFEIRRRRARRTGSGRRSRRWRRGRAGSRSPAGCAGRTGRSATGSGSSRRRANQLRFTVGVEDAGARGEPHRAPARHQRRGGVLRLRAAAHLFQPEGQPPADPGAGARDRARAAVVVTRMVDLFASDGGGSPYVTECPAPQFITTRLRSLFLENLEYCDLRPAPERPVRRQGLVGGDDGAASSTGRRRSS